LGDFYCFFNQAKEGHYLPVKEGFSLWIIHLYLQVLYEIGGESHFFPASLDGLLVLMNSSFFFPLMKLQFLLSQVCRLALVLSWIPATTCTGRG